MTISNSSYNDALKFVLRWEGGYSNHPADKGGETNFGITHATYDSYRNRKKLPKRSVRFIETFEVSEIYYVHYWSPSGCELLPEKLALAHFDWAVNAGVKRAIQTLQLVVGTPNDGIIGAKTKAALTTALQTKSSKSLVNSYCIIRENHYRKWGTGSQRVFLTGWLNRLTALKQIVI